MEDISKPSVYETNFTSKSTQSFYIFTGSLFCEIPKAPSLFKEWIATERLITKESSSWDGKKFTQRAGRVPRRGEANDK